ncbi:MAG TPA: hypothetical protein VGM29_06115 [Polyangiaceae bacterium]|jgi:hypothetical protein
MNSRSRQSGLLPQYVCPLLLLFMSCNKHAKSEPAPAGTVAPLAASAAASEKPPERPWFAGKFVGSYLAENAAPKAEVGAPRQWQKDDGKTAVGPGTLTLSIADDGAIQGSAQGVLGDEVLNGKVENDVVRGTLLASNDTSFRGTLIAARSGDGFTGSIHASSADSNTVRAASLELKRQP